MHLYRVWPVILLMLTAACQNDRLTDPLLGHAAYDDIPNSGSPHGQVPLTSDDDFDRIARNEVPGFGGYYFDDQGTPTVRLTSRGQAEGAKRFVQIRLQAHRRGHDDRMRRNPGASDTIRVVAADYDFTQLKGWGDRLQTAVGQSGVHMLDIDERANRVWIGVEDAGAVETVRAAMRSAKVPQGAVEIQVVPAPESRAQYLTERFDTTWAGIQIDKTPGFGGECTLGFNADYNGYVIFVTNSHCTQSYFAQDNGTIYQNEAAAGDELGTELYDRGTWASCGFLTCRYSDAAYIVRNGNRLTPREATYRIAGLQGYAYGMPSSTELYSTTLPYEGRSTPIIGKLNNASLTVGTFLDKTGRTSGNTIGYITRSCVRIDRLLCQYVTDIYSAPGDSGSPIRQVDLYGSLLAGILWGGPANDYNVTYFSPISGIETDLGAITVCTQYFTC